MIIAFVFIFQLQKTFGKAIKEKMKKKKKEDKKDQEESDRKILHKAAETVKKGSKD